MIKMIASDLDGTLLNAGKEFPPHFEDVVSQLKERGILFVAASGRGRRSLCQILGDLQIAMVADNGGTAYTIEGERIFTGTFTYDQAKPVLGLVKKVPFMHPVIISAQDVYVQEDEPGEVRDFMKCYFRGMIREVSNVLEIFDREPVVKISVNTGPDGANEDKALAMMRGGVSDEFGYTLSGDGWLDIQRADINKGSAILAMGRYYGYTADQIMVFGDYLNDYEFLQATPNSYAMKNAHPAIKKIAAHITAFSNEEYGVIRELENIFGITYKAGVSTT